jgi:hypothetical protein
MSRESGGLDLGKIFKPPSGELKRMAVERSIPIHTVRLSLSLLPWDSPECIVQSIL